MLSERILVPRGVNSRGFFTTTLRLVRREAVTGSSRDANYLLCVGVVNFCGRRAEVFEVGVDAAKCFLFLFGVLGPSTSSSK